MIFTSQYKIIKNYHWTTKRDIKHKKNKRGYTLVELLLALSLTALIGAGIAAALNASFIAYASASEMAGTQMSSRMVMNKMMSMIRRSTAHDAYDPNDNTVTLLTPSAANYPLKTVGIQMILPDESRFCAWWAVNGTYNDASTGDLWYQNMDASGNLTGTASMMLPRAKCQWTTDTPATPYVFTLGSRISDTGLLLTRATLNLSVQPDPAAILNIQQAKGTDTDIHLISSPMPRKTIDM